MLMRDEDLVQRLCHSHRHTPKYFKPFDYILAYALLFFVLLLLTFRFGRLLATLALGFYILE